MSQFWLSVTLKNSRLFLNHPQISESKKRKTTCWFSLFIVVSGHDSFINAKHPPFFVLKMGNFPQDGRCLGLPSFAGQEFPQLLRSCRPRCGSRGWITTTGQPTPPPDLNPPQNSRPYEGLTNDWFPLRRPY